MPPGTHPTSAADLPVAAPIRGGHDGAASMADLRDASDRPPDGDRRSAVPPSRAAHALAVGQNRARFWRAARAFPSTPAPVAARRSGAPRD